MKEEFMQCPRCSTWVCKHNCWNDERGLCKSCASTVAVETTTAASMTCPSCGVSLTMTAKFCPDCGAKVQPKDVCAACGVKLAPGAKFCPECGAKVQ
jgi:predicted amidophosphoribosyltransferase